MTDFIEEKTINEKTIFVVPNEIKNYLIQRKKDNPYLDYKVFTINDIIRNLKGNERNVSAINLAFKFLPELSYNTIKEVLHYLYFSFDLKNETNEKFINLYKELKENDLLKIDEDFLLLLKSRKIIFINFEESTYIKNFIEFYEIKNYEFCSLKDLFKESENRTYHSLFNIGDELHYGLTYLLKELKNGAKPEDFYIYLDYDRYEFYLKLFLNDIDVPTNVTEKATLFDLPLSKKLFPLIDDNFKILEYLESIGEEEKDDEYHLIYNKLRSLNIDDLKNKLINFKEILQSTKIEEIKNANSIKFSNSIEINPFKRILVFGLDQKLLPKNIKDNKYFLRSYLFDKGFDSLDEEVRMKNNIEETFLKLNNIELVLNHKKDNAGSNDDSYYLKSLGFKRIKESLIKEEYNEEILKLFYRDELDKFLRTKEISNNLKNYKTYFNEPFEFYDNSYTRIQNFEFDFSKSLSYSSIYEYRKCPFLYFLDRVIKVDVNQDTLALKFGNIAHAILEHVYESDFNFKDVKEKTIEEFSANNDGVPYLDNRENILLIKPFEELENTINLILEHKNNMSYKTSYSETSLSRDENFIYQDVIDEGDKIYTVDLPMKIKLYGKLDSIIETTDDSLFIIDYKTGADSFSKTDFTNKLIDIQLPSYMYLMEMNKNKELSGKTVAGLFIQPILPNKGKGFYNFYKPTPEDIDSLKLNGIFLYDLDRLQKFDYSTLSEGTKDSKYIARLSINGNGTINKQKKAFVTLQELTDYSNLVKQIFIDWSSRIRFANFEIKPDTKVLNPCSYCNHHDICFKKL